MTVELVRVADGVWAGYARCNWALRHGRLTGADRRTGAALPPWRAREHLASRALLRLLLADTAGAAACRRAAGAELAAEPGGRPYLPEYPAVEVSLSHTGDHVAAAVSTGQPVGVDVEEPIEPSPGMLRRCCDPDAVALLAGWSPAERAAEFTTMWTAKEACVKATGVGIAGAPWRIPVRPTQRSGRWGRVCWATLRAGRPAVSCAWGAP